MSFDSSRQRLSALMFFASSLLLFQCHAQNEAASQAPPLATSVVGAHTVIPAGTIVRVGFKHSVHPTDLRAGGVLDGELADPLYFRGAVVVPAGQTVRV